LRSKDLPQPQVSASDAQQMPDQIQRLVAAKFTQRMAAPDQIKVARNDQHFLILHTV